MYLAREPYPDGIVYYSQATHYSVVKNLHILRQKACEIPVQSNGEMDYNHLTTTLKKYPNQPTIIFCNIGRKFLGSPIPCGVVLAEKKFVEIIKRHISYIRAPDTTITGSRNSFTPLVLWYRIKSLGRDGIQKRVQTSLDIAAYTEAKLNEIGISAWRNPDSIVVFPEVQDDLNKMASVQ
ncbi:hypothetical protein THRCLA_10292, partial [Thraustotheca clavata]